MRMADIASGYCATRSTFDVVVYPTDVRQFIVISELPDNPTPAPARRVFPSECCNASHADRVAALALALLNAGADPNYRRVTAANNITAALEARAGTSA